QGCHIKDGRGHPPEEGQSNLVSTLVRLSIPATAERPRKIHEAVIAEPVYGDQAQDFAVPGVTPEMRIIWHWEQLEMPLADGSTAVLRKPRLEFTDLAYGDLHPDLMYSPRVAPAMIGLGLLEAIPEESIRAGADPDDADGDGISGRSNEVWDQRTNSLNLGRYGWKAGKPTVEQQVAGAFFGDMGLSSSLNLANPCSETQTECMKAPDGGSPEVSDETMAFVTFYSSHLAVPARPDATDKNILAGQELFASTGCASCHRPSWETGDSESAALANQTIYPYTDMLLHDMGKGLADNRPEFQASGREWRTAPLWGLGDYEDVNGHTQLLHDGRARNITEAILWHGGEATSSRDNFIQLPREKKQLLLNFLKSL
ncbi:MAG: di-heme oxidoredictase family protein, partial [Pseudomonadales bacterium]